MSRILIIEDEESIANLEKDYLELSGFEVEIENQGDVGLKRALSEDFDLFILDLMLPEMDGFEICKEIRNHKNTPILMVSAKKDDIDKIRGLGLGADDYITKPFRIQIAMEKIQAVLRRCGGRHEEPCYSCGNLDIDFEKRIVRKSGELLELTPTEFDLLQFFCKNRRKILTKDILLENIWDNRRRFVSEHTLSLNISRLRNKIADDQFDYIKTIYGMGYRWIGAGEAGV